MKAQISVNKNAVVGNVDKRIYGSFIEHIGRAVYGGIYEPNNKSADECGFRKDVIELTKKINVPVVRYPGGNFVSGYHWEDGIGDRSKRPRKLELSWLSIETNEVGIDEFQEWAKRADTEIMMAVNLGLRGADDARNLLEYCNCSTDTYYANLRRANGFEQPFDIKLWCLGNEMDGPWQMGHKTAYEYGRLADETAKILRRIDPSIELVACGSSGYDMPTFGEWEHTVLTECYDSVDYISLHSYCGNPDNDTPTFLGSSINMDKFIKTVISICDQVKKEKKSEKTINLSFDEWNVWFHSGEHDKKLDKWQVAPPILQDIYTFEDALVVGTLLTTLLNNCDRVKIACIAQLVNVIAPILTKTGGEAIAQTIYYPYMYTSLYGRGTALKVMCACDNYDTEKIKNIPYIESACILSEDGKTLSLIVINRSLTENCELEISALGFGDIKLKKHIALENDDLKAENTFENSQNVIPCEKEIKKDIELEKHSWNLLVFDVK